MTLNPEQTEASETNQEGGKLCIPESFYLGCPDCADGGAEGIRITTKEGEKSVLFDFNAKIEQIEPFLSQLRLLRLSMEAKIRKRID